MVNIFGMVTTSKRRIGRRPSTHIRVDPDVKQTLKILTRKKGKKSINALLREMSRSL